MLLFLRHAPTDYNAAGQERVRGTRDVPLSPQGHRDAQAAATRLKALQDSGTPITRILSCDLTRARQTAAPIGEALGLPVHYTPALRTWPLGDLEGQPIDDHTRALIHGYAQAPDRTPHGGESYRNWSARLLSFLTPFHDRPDELTLVITHGQNIRAVQGWAVAGGKGITVDPTVAANGKVGVEHAGLALLAAPDQFTYLDPKPSTGLS